MSSKKTAKKKTRAGEKVSHDKGRTSAKKGTSQKAHSVQKKKGSKEAGKRTKSTRRSDGFKKVQVYKVSERLGEKQRLVHAARGSSFWVNGGPELRNLLDLHDALGVISDEQYSHHVRNDSDNDFSRWVEDVLCDGQCAISLKGAEDKRKARAIIAKRLRLYEI